jgi:hypothetical protein
LKEDLTPADIESILNDLKSGKKPKAGPRYFFDYINWYLVNETAIKFSILIK